VAIDDDAGQLDERWQIERRFFRELLILDRFRDPAS
jgi:hypothetical protein